MISPPTGIRVWLAAALTDMQRCVDGLARQVEQVLGHDPFDGRLFVFNGRRGDLINVLFRVGQGFCCADAMSSATIRPALDLSSLPADVRDLIETQDTTIVRQDGELANHRATVEALKLRSARLRRMQFVRSSERIAAEIARLALRLRISRLA